MEREMRRWEGEKKRKGEREGGVTNQTLFSSV